MGSRNNQRIYMYLVTEYNAIRPIYVMTARSCQSMSSIIVIVVVSVLIKCSVVLRPIWQDVSIKFSGLQLDLSRRMKPYYEEVAHNASMFDFNNFSNKMLRKVFKKMAGDGWAALTDDKYNTVSETHH